MPDLRNFCALAWRISRRSILVLLACTIAGPAHALDPARTISEYAHTIFDAKSGAPRNIIALAQASDNRLLIGTGGGGLYRFDGTVFEAIPKLGEEDIQSRTILAMRVDRQGGLWLGYGGFGAGYLAADGKYTRLGRESGWTTTTFFREDLDGTVWAITGSRLVRVRDLKLEPLSPEWGLGDAQVYEMEVDRRGTLWVASRDEAQVFYLPRGERRFRKALDVQAVRMVEAPDGSMWVSSVMGTGRIQLADGHPVRFERLGSEVLNYMLIDRDGMLWASVQDAALALARTSAAGTPPRNLFADRYTESTGLSSPAITDLLEDRDGNVWVATQVGLDRFRKAPFRPIRARSSSGHAVVARSDSEIWTGTWLNPTSVVRDGVLKPGRAAPDYLRTLIIDRQGGIWTGGGKGVHYARDGRSFATVPLPEEILDRRIASLAQDDAGNMWAATSAPGPVGIVSPAGWRTPEPIEGLPPSFAAVRLYGDRAGVLWLADRKQLLALRGNRADVVLNDLSTEGVGLIHVFSEDPRGLWMGGQLGIAQLSNGRVQRLRGTGGMTFGEPMGLLVHVNGDLWLQNVSGVYRIAKQELEAWRDSPRHEVTWERFDEADGLAGLTTMGSPLPTIAQLADGTLWLGSSKGLSSLAVDALDIPPRQHEISWNGVRADGEVLPVTDRIDLPPQVRQIEIGFGTIDLSTPERVRYRFRLDGLDTAWQEVGNRRSAFYTNLNPGTYRFRVMATGRSGFWDGPERSIDLEVAPAWFQTLWFKAACGAVVILMVALIYRLRIRQVTEKVRLKLQAREEERERIARDLHDTLLQSMHVLVWRIGAETVRLDAHDARRGPLDQVLALAERTLVEGRNRIVHLRSMSAQRPPIWIALKREAQLMAIHDAPTYDDEVHGEARPLSPAVWDELFGIMKEAMTNSFRHAGASTVRLRVLFSNVELSMALMDDGSGIPPDVAIEGRSGHFGLMGMRERAREIGARLVIERRAEGGTLVEVIVPLVPNGKAR